MAVKFSRPHGTGRTFRDWTLLLVLAGVSMLTIVSTSAGQTSREENQSLGDQLYAEANDAVTIEDQNRVLQKIGEVRERDIDEQLSRYLTGLEAWLLHQRGEAFAKQAAEANRRGDTQQGRELDAKAMEDFDAAIGLDPTRWKSYHHRGVGFALAGQFDRALEDFSKTLELNPKYTNAWFNRGEIHYELGRYAEAVEDYSQAIARRPQDAGFFTGRGHAYFQLRRFERALEDYHQAVNLDTDNDEYFANRGDAYRSLGTWDKAANDFRQAITINPRFGRAYQSAAWLMATCPDRDFRHAELAVRAAQKALELDGESDYIYLDTLAAALANAGKFDEAQEVLRRAIAAAPRENVEPLRQRLKLYQSQRPYRQTVATTVERSAASPRRN